MALLNHFRSKSVALLCTVILLRSVPAFAGTLSIFDPISIEKQEQKLYVNTQLFLANDAFSLEALFNDFSGKYHYEKDKNYALGDIRIDVGTYIDSLGYLGYTYRREAVIGTSSDTVKLIHQTKNEMDLTIGETYELDLEIEGFEVHGITLANAFSVYQKKGWDVKVGLGAELLYGVGSQHGYALGDARANAVNDYDFTFYSEYSYTENYLYDLDVEKTTAYGYTTHLALQASYEQFTLLGIINDAWGQLYWKN